MLWLSYVNILWNSYNLEITKITDLCIYKVHMYVLLVVADDIETNNCVRINILLRDEFEK